MEQEFWLERYQSNRIGFHQPEGNPWLRAFVDRLPPQGRVLVPLAGKTPDMRFLAEQGHFVVGVEFVEEAVRAFFDEQGLTPMEEGSDKDPRVFRAGPIRIFARDFFTLSPAEVGPVDSVYDRASMVALSPDERKRYAAHLTSLIPEKAPILLVSFEYDQTQMSGPPFSVPVEELDRHFPDANFELLHEHDAIDKAQHIAAQGVTSFIERVHLIRGAGRAPE